MEPVCQGCSAKMEDMKEWVILYHYTKGRNPVEGHPGNLYCNVCITMMVYLLHREKLSDRQQ